MANIHEFEEIDFPKCEHGEIEDELTYDGKLIDRQWISNGIELKIDCMYYCLY